MKFPVDKPHRIGLKFGARYGSVLSRILGSTHQGVDVLPETNDDIPVKAIGNGNLTRAGYAGSCGLSVDYTTGEYTVRYCHLKSISAKIGNISEGQELGIMGATGVSSPPGFRHLHWVMWLRGKLIDALSLPYTYASADKKPSINIPIEFQRIWHRPGAKGEIAYFQRRFDRGSVKNLEELKSAMDKWYRIVYPNGKFSITGNAKWQFEKVR